LMYIIDVYYLRKEKYRRNIVKQVAVAS